MALSIDEANARLTAAGERYEIEEKEIRGHSIRVWKNAPASLPEILETSRSHGERTALVYENERLSFEEHFQAVAAVSRALVERYGVRRGDRVAIAMRNYPEWSIAFWATAAAGAIAVPLNAWWTGKELHYGLADSGSKVLFADEERGRRVEEVREDLELEHLVLARSTAAPRGWELFDDLIREARPGLALPVVELEPEDDATIFYTSGTTGAPKGALGTHRNICTNVFSVEFLRARAALRTGTAPPADLKLANLLTVPLFHVTGCHSTLAPSLATGAKLVLVYKFIPEEAVKIIEQERITSFGGVPAVAWQVLECPSRPYHDLSSVLRIAYGGAPAAPELVRRIKELFPTVTPSNGYGLTETSAVTSSNAGDDYVAKPDSVGPAVPVCRVKVVDGDGQTLPTDEVGELWIQGPNVIKGYWNKPEATREAITDSWLHSGDLARLDDEGLIYIVDRAKDMVIRGGENIYCVEVESVLFEHPDVIEAAVVGRPHRVLGEEVVAVVRVKPDSRATEEELKTHAAASLAPFKVPVLIDLRTEDLPRNPNGKILKAELKKQILGSGQ